MIALPPAIAQQFEQFLTRKGLPPTVRLFYAKWLRFYWDFCHKYRHDSLHSDSLPLFLRKNCGTNINRTRSGKKRSMPFPCSMKCRLPLCAVLSIQSQLRVFLS